MYGFLPQDSMSLESIGMLLWYEVQKRHATALFQSFSTDRLHARIYNLLCVLLMLQPYYEIAKLPFNSSMLYRHIASLYARHYC
jgi:hypothetical protein